MVGKMENKFSKHWKVNGHEKHENPQRFPTLENPLLRRGGHGPGWVFVFQCLEKQNNDLGGLTRFRLYAGDTPFYRLTQHLGFLS